MKATITGTTNYKLFDFSVINRDFKPGKHALLRKSLKEHGYDPARPIVCFRNARRRLEVVDGQHRLNFCRELGIPVYYTITEHTDPVEYNAPTVGWSIKDYMKSWACRGIRDYEILSSFTERHKLPITSAANMLVGRGYSSGKIATEIKGGKFKAGDVPFAERCAEAITSISKHFKEGKASLFISAIMQCMMVDEFDISRMISKIRKHPGRLEPRSRIDQHLEQLESLYNFANKTRQIPLKFLAEQAAKK